MIYFYCCRGDGVNLPAAQEADIGRKINTTTFSLYLTSLLIPKIKTILRNKIKKVSYLVNRQRTEIIFLLCITT